MRKVFCMNGAVPLRTKMIEDLAQQIRGRIEGLKPQVIASPTRNCQLNAYNFSRHFPRLKPIILNGLGQPEQSWQADSQHAFEQIEAELVTLDDMQAVVIMVASAPTIHGYTSLKTDEKIPFLFPGRTLVLNFDPGIEPAFEYFDPNPPWPTS